MPKKSKPGNGPETLVNGVDLAAVERLLEFMQKHGLEEFEYEKEGVHVRLKKTPAPGGGGHRAAGPLVENPAGAHVHAAPLHESGGESGRPAGGHIIKSPIVGTFYAAPSPGAEPFVKVGAHVQPGQVLCIIEAMKLMNEIESDIAGEVTHIFIESGKPVEYGEALFAIKPQPKKQTPKTAASD